MYNAILTLIHNNVYNNIEGGMSMADSLGARIRQARIRYGMSQAELARRIGVSKNTMNLIESGKTPDPAVSRIRAIADTLNVSMDYLAGRSKEEESELLAAAVA
jgi:transcriptional regulator with XRE-family HTH domain